MLKSLLEYWKSQQNDEEPVATSQLLKPHTTSSPPDMSPFFLRQYVKVSPALYLAVGGDFHIKSQTCSATFIPVETFDICTGAVKKG